MDYLSNYYKNLCEQLQEKINILEAGLQQAMKTGEPEMMKKEFLKGKARKVRKLSAAREEENKAEKEKNSFFGPGRSRMRQMTANALRAQAERIGQNVEALHQQLDADYPEMGAKLTQIDPIEFVPYELEPNDPRRLNPRQHYPHSTGSQPY
jgi:hypothetical protein